MFYTAVVTVPKLRIQALISLIEKVQIQAKEKGMTDEAILQARLAPDMFPFVRQIQIISDGAKWNAARLARTESPKMEDNELTLDALKDRLAKTVSYLDTLTEADFVDAATAEIRYSFMPGKKMVGEGFLLTFALPNFFFHVVTAYNILRNQGFDIGKMDYISQNAEILEDVA